ncbi:MAG: hypothetical protein KDB00_11975 [Planctomycetales bacterium]|nr:hypothetical protein [Planctomycetales bacterium]
MANSANPYAAPLADSMPLGLGPEPADLVPRRLEFSGHLTRQHHRDAVVKAGIRKDYRRIFKLIAAFAVIYCAITIVPVLASPQKDTAFVIRTIASTFFYVLGVGLFYRMQLRSLTVRLPGFQLVTGDIKGWLDRDELCIQADGYSAVVPLSKLVSVASTHEIGVLSFSTDQMYWHVVPMDGFDDPALARSVFADLQRIRPPMMPQLDDERRRAVPDHPFRFSPQGDAVRFDGKTHQDSAEGTLFAAEAKRITRRMWITIAVFLGCLLVSMNISFQVGTAASIILAIWFVFVVAMIYFRLWRTRRRAKDAGRVVVLYSIGWLDDYGYCALTAIGQARMAWSFFRRYEITDRVIAFYPSEYDAVCCPISREEFAGDEDWNRATKLVHEKMAAATQTPLWSTTN